MLTYPLEESLEHGHGVRKLFVTGFLPFLALENEVVEDWEKGWFVVLDDVNGERSSDNRMWPCLSS